MPRRQPPAAPPVRLFRAELPVLDSKNAVQLLQDFAQFKGALRVRPEGGYYLTVPSHPTAPLRTHRLLNEFCCGRSYARMQWRLYQLDENGCPTVAITEDTP